MENICRDVGSYDMSYIEYKEICTKTKEGALHYLQSDGFKKTIKEDTVFVIKVKTHTLN